jgi:hypothetical protein
MMNYLFRHRELLKISATIMILRRQREARSSAEFGVDPVVRREMLRVKSDE